MAFSSGFNTVNRRSMAADLTTFCIYFDKPSYNVHTMMSSTYLLTKSLSGDNAFILSNTSPSKMFRCISAKRGATVVPMGTPSFWIYYL